MSEISFEIKTETTTLIKFNLNEIQDIISKFALIELRKQNVLFELKFNKIEFDESSLGELRGCTVLFKSVDVKTI